MWASEDAALAASRAWLEDARHIMLSRVAAADVDATKNKAEWRDGEAAAPLGGRASPRRARWAGRGGVDAQLDRHAASASDVQLLQEYYAHGGGGGRARVAC